MTSLHFARVQCFSLDTMDISFLVFRATFRWPLCHRILLTMKSVDPCWMQFTALYNILIMPSLHFLGQNFHRPYTVQIACFEVYSLIAVTKDCWWTGQSTTVRRSFSPSTSSISRPIFIIFVRYSFCHIRCICDAFVIRPYQVAKRIWWSDVWTHIRREVACSPPFRSRPVFFSSVCIVADVWPWKYRLPCM